MRTRCAVTLFSLSTQPIKLYGTRVPDWEELLVPAVVVPREEVGPDGEVDELDVQRGGDAAVARGDVPEDHVPLRQELQPQRRLPAHAQQVRLRQHEVHVHAGAALVRGPGEGVGGRGEELEGRGVRSCRGGGTEVRTCSLAACRNSLRQPRSEYS